MDAKNREMDARSIVTTRLIDAPRDLVFEAWSDPKHLSVWWGPNGFSTTTSAFDFRVGGMWRFVMHGPDGRDYQNRITYDEIVRPERISYTHGGGDDSEPVQFRSVVTFEDVGGQTRLTMRGIFPSAEARDRVIREHGAVQGGQQTIGKLAGYLTLGRPEGDPEFVVIRVLDAPRKLVWEAYTQVEHLSKWWGPKGFDWIHGTLDLRPGGLFHYAMRAPQGAEMWGKFTYREIAAPGKIVFTTSFSDKNGNTVRAPFAPDFPMEVLNTVTFLEHDGQTTIVMRGTPLNASDAERARFAAMKPSMNQGFSGTFAQFDEYLARLKQGK